MANSSQSKLLLLQQMQGAASAHTPQRRGTGWVPRAPHALPARERVGLRVAVAVPFVARQLVRLERTMERWAMFAPCAPQATAARGDDGSCRDSASCPYLADTSSARR